MVVYIDPYGFPDIDDIKANVSVAAYIIFYGFPEFDHIKANVSIVV